jgi:hypothetical protein
VRCCHGFGGGPPAAEPGQLKQNGGFGVRRAKHASIVVTAAALVAGVLSITGPAQAAVTAAAGIPITIENSGKCMNVAGASTANGAKVIQYTCVASALNDKWSVDSIGNDKYQIKNIGSGKCLTVLGASTSNNASLIQWACTTNGNETWYIESQYERPTMRLISVGSGLCLDVPGRSVDNNVNLIQYTCQAGDGTSNERVIMPPTTSAAVVHRPYTSKQPVAVVQDGQAAANGTKPVSYNWIGADNELYTITDFNPDWVQPDPSAPAPAGYYTTGYGYTGRPAAAVLADQRVHVIAHDAAAGDVQYWDETTGGTGEYGDLYDIGGAMDAQPTLGPSGGPGQAVYAVIGGVLWFDPEGPGNLYSPIGDWRSLGGTGLTGVPASVRNGSGARVFARTTTGAIQTATLSGQTLSDWSSLGGTGLGDPNVLALPGNLSLVSARAVDGSIVYKKQNADGTFPAAWTTITGLASAGNPSAVIGSADGRIDIAIRGTDSLVYVSQETAAGSGQFGGWTQLSDPTGDPNTIAASDPTAFAYDVPSGKSFGVIFQSTNPDLDGPYGVYLAPGWDPTAPAAAVARTAKARTGLHYEKIAKPKKMEKASAKKTAMAH